MAVNTRLVVKSEVIPLELLLMAVTTLLAQLQWQQSSNAMLSTISSRIH